MNLATAHPEGDANQNDNPAFTGSKGIIQKKAFRKPIRSQRCLVLASAFIEIPKLPGQPKPYQGYLCNFVNPFAFTGIWDAWHNPDTSETFFSFCIITTTANSLLRQIGVNHSSMLTVF